LIVNGNFSTGDFAGWTVFNQAGGNGNWSVYSGTTAPNSFAIPAPPGSDTFASVTSQFGPGTHILYQVVNLPPGKTLTLSFKMFWQNEAGSWFTPASLDFTTIPNQQYRADVVAAPGGTLAGSEETLIGVLNTPAKATVGDPARSGGAAADPANWVSFGPIDLTPLAGQSVAIRFAEVDNQLFFELGVADVSLIAS
jgi:hypothetical protein